MALDANKKASRLFKKSLGVGETLITNDFFEEPKLGNSNIIPSQIWSESDSIPVPAPILPDQGTSGVVQYFDKLTLIHISTSSNMAYYHDNLKNTIPFNYGDGSYNYKLYKNDGTTQIAFGEGDWLIDVTAGLLTFYGTLPSGVASVTPPKISFYKYIGTTGFTTLVSDISTAISTEVSDRNSADESLSTAISDSLSTEVSTRESVDMSLSTALQSVVYDSAYSDSIGVAYTVGGVVSGTLIGTLTGKTFSQLFDDIFVPTILASIGTSNSASLAGVSPTTVEVGTAYNPSTTATYNPGSITNGNGSVGPNLTGNGNNYVFKLPNSSTDGTYGTIGNSQGHTYTSYNVAFGTNTWSVTISYSSAVGVGTYYDNKGNPGSNLDGSRGSGSLTVSSGTITARRRYWYGTGTAGSAPTNSAGVRALTSYGLLSASNTGTFDISIPASTRGVWFFLPAGKTVVVQYVESSFADVTSSFTTSAITVNDAAGTGQSYASYVTDIGGSGYPGTATYRVTVS
jgi:hypothetical protein